MLLCGCSDTAEEQKSTGEQVQQDEAAAVNDMGKSPNEPNGFPSFLVGTWVANKGKWEFVFEADGTISSAVIDNGIVRVDPRQRVTEIKLPAGEGMYQMGECVAEYSSGSNELAVVIIVDYYRLQRPDIIVEGSSKDWFTGTISEDHETWVAQWFSLPKVFVTSLEGDAEETLEMEADPNTPPEMVIFKKQP